MSEKLKSLIENEKLFFFVEIASIIVIIAIGLTYGFSEYEINWIFITCLLLVVEIIFEILKKNNKKKNKEINDNKITPTNPGKILLRILSIICISLISIVLFLIVFL